MILPLFPLLVSFMAMNMKLNAQIFCVEQVKRSARSAILPMVSSAVLVSK